MPAQCPLCGKTLENGQTACSCIQPEGQLSQEQGVMRALLAAGSVLVVLVGILVAVGVVIGKRLSRELSRGTPTAASDASAPDQKPSPSAAPHSDWSKPHPIPPLAPAPPTPAAPLPGPAAPVTPTPDDPARRSARIQQKIDEVTKQADAMARERSTRDLQSPDPSRQVQAAVSLAQRGDPRGLAFMRQAVNAEDTTLREKAIAATGKIGGPVAVKILIDRVSGKGFDSPADAVRALVAMGEPAVAPMVAALPGMTDNARWQMLPGLVRMGEPAMKRLAAMLPTASPELKKTACQVLGGMGDRPDVTHPPTEPLIALLTDPDAEVRRSAAHGLELLHWKPENPAEKQEFENAK